MARIPHFDLPFNFAAGGGHAVVVEQDSLDDIGNCVEAVIRTPIGSRPYVPKFGIDDPVFENEDVNIAAIAQQVTINEPRAVTVFSQFIDSLDSMITRIRTEVRARG